MTSEDTRFRFQNRAEAYVAARGMGLADFLGFGNDGEVWASTSGSVVKIEERESSFDRELNCYLRLKERKISSLDGFAVPRLLGFDRSLQAIEMTFVFPPCILDFAKSYVDKPPDYDPETIRDWEQETQEFFDERWPVVRQLLSAMTQDFRRPGEGDNVSEGELQDESFPGRSVAEAAEVYG